MKPLTAVLCFAFLLGCARTPSYQQPVKADTPINFAMWRSENSDTLTPKEWQLFDQAMNELKLKTQLEGKASGSDAVDAAVRNQIDGMKLCEVILSGLQTRLRRLSADKTILEESLSFNSQLKIKSGDEEKKQMLAEKVQAQTARLAELQATVAGAEADLHELELKFK